MLALVACGSAAAPSTDTAPDLPPTDGVFDYQLGGIADQLSDGTPIDVVARDATAEPIEGAYNVCYVNGFQTQPGADWSGHPSAVLRDASGDPVRDPDWPDEIILDPSTASARAAILEVVGPIIEGCADDGFDAVEIDNLDTWTRFDSISRDGAFALASAYVTAAHDLGLAIAPEERRRSRPTGSRRPRLRLRRRRGVRRVLRVRRIHRRLRLPRAPDRVPRIPRRSRPFLRRCLHRPPPRPAHHPPRPRPRGAGRPGVRQ